MLQNSRQAGEIVQESVGGGWPAGEDFLAESLHLSGCAVMTRLETDADDPFRDGVHCSHFRGSRTRGGQDRRQSAARGSCLDGGGQPADVEPPEEARRVGGGHPTRSRHGGQGALVALDRVGVSRDSNEFHDPTRPRRRLGKHDECRPTEVIRLPADEKPVNRCLDAELLQRGRDDVRRPGVACCDRHLRPPRKPHRQPGHDEDETPAKGTCSRPWRRPGRERVGHDIAAVARNEQPRTVPASEHHVASARVAVQRRLALDDHRRDPFGLSGRELRPGDHQIQGRRPGRVESRAHERRQPGLGAR